MRTPLPKNHEATDFTDPSVEFTLPLKKLHRPVWWHSLASIIFVLGTLVVALTVFGQWPNPGTFLLAFLLISSRQHALLILEHECWHALMFRSKRLNHFVGQVIGYSVYSKYWSSRKNHLDHHHHLGTPEDPDFILHVSCTRPNREALVISLLKSMLGGQAKFSYQPTTKSKLISPELIDVAFAQAILFSSFLLLSDGNFILLYGFFQH